MENSEFEFTINDKIKFVVVFLLTMFALFAL